MTMTHFHLPRDVEFSWDGTLARRHHRDCRGRGLVPPNPPNSVVVVVAAGKGLVVGLLLLWQEMSR